MEIKSARTVACVPTTYDVKVVRESIALAEVMGAGAGYSVQLDGPIDGTWLDCYRRLRADSPSFFRFCLEGDRVLFACRAGDAISDVGLILRLLDTLVERVNELATASAPAD